VSDPDPVIRRVSAEILGNLEVPEANATLVAGLEDPDPIVRVALLRSLGRAGAQGALLEVVAALDDPEPEVRLEAVQTARALAGYRRGLLIQVERLLEDPAPEVRSCVAVILLAEGPHPEASRVLRDMVGTAEPQARKAVLDSIARWGDLAGFELALDCLGDSHPSVRRAAVSALARSAPQGGLPRLVQLLGDGDRSVREAVAARLGELGSQALGPVLEALDDPRLVEGALLTLQSLPARRELPRLIGFAQDKARLAQHYLGLWRGASAIGNPSPASELFSDALIYSARRAARQAILAVGLQKDPAAASLALDNLDSREAGQRVNAMEMVDSLGERELVGPLLQIWEAQRVLAAAGSEQEWLERGLEDADPWVRACAALAAGESQNPALEDQLRRRVQSDPDSLVRETALRSLNGGVIMETLPTLSTMERILFLRRVPLFADLSPDELKQVALVTSELSFSQSEMLARQGEAGDEMYVILEGEIEVSVDGTAGNREVLARRGPGEVVGEMSIISHEPRMASLIAASDLRILRIAQKEFEGILRERPQTGLAVMRVLIKRLKEAQPTETAP
jgi:HEAT repeat protein